MRTHKSKEEAEHVCEVEACGQRFWTATHLAQHALLHNRAKPHIVSGWSSRSEEALTG